MSWLVACVLVPDLSLLTYLTKVHSSLACHLRYLLFPLCRFQELCSLEECSFHFILSSFASDLETRIICSLWLFISLAMHIHLHSIIFSFQLPCWWWTVGGDGVLGWRLFNRCCHRDMYGWRTDCCCLSGGEGSHLWFCLCGHGDASVSVVLSLYGEERADPLQQLSFCPCLQGTFCSNSWCFPFKS